MGFSSTRFTQEFLTACCGGLLIFFAMFASGASIPNAVENQVNTDARLLELEQSFIRFQEEFSKQKLEMEKLWDSHVKQASRIEHLEAVIAYQSKQLSDIFRNSVQDNSARDSSLVTPKNNENTETLKNVEIDSQTIETTPLKKDATRGDVTLTSVSPHQFRRLERTLHKHSRQLDFLLKENGVDEKLRPLVPKDVDLSNDDGEDTQSTRHKRAIRARTEPIYSVAFSAYLETPALDLYIQETLVMGGVLLNDGAAYSPSNGVFTCPIGGVYMFTFFVADVEIEELNVMLVVNGENKIGASAEPKHYSQDIQGGNVVILRLVPDDRVWLRTVDINGVNVYGSHQFRDTSFSGVLLYH